MSAPYQTFLRSGVGNIRAISDEVLRRLRRGLAPLWLMVDARSARSRILRSRERRGLFIDCGSNLGQGFSYFKRHFPSHLFDYILIEPNPYCVERLEAIRGQSLDNIEVIDAAASSRDGFAKFYGLIEDGRGNTSEGGSILPDHASAWYAANEERALMVRTFSLSHLIASKRSSYASIVMKMDIESAEYEVLADLAATGTHRFLSCLYVEFHCQYMTQPNRSIYAAREEEIVRRYRADGVPLRRWI